MKIGAVVFLVVYFFSVPFTAFSALAAKPRADVVLLVAPVSVRFPEAGRTVDALEKQPEEMGASWQLVVFRIERVLKGNFKTFKAKEPSLWNQMKDAVDDKNIIKLVAMDFERPSDEPVEKNILSMAVVDPEASFGITGEALPQKQLFKIGLAMIQREPKSYVMVSNEKA